MLKEMIAGTLLMLFIVSILSSEFNMVPVTTADTPEEGLIHSFFLDEIGTHFELNNSEYLNVTIDSTAVVHIILSAPRDMIDYYIESADMSDLTTLTLSNLQPSTTYYIYEDSYMNEVVFVTNSDGSYTYTQDLSQWHHVFIQTKSGTTFIYENTTLTADIYETVEICANNVVLDLNGHSIIAPYPFYGRGILCSGTGVTIMNGTIDGFTFGIYPSSYTTIHGTNITNCWSHGLECWSPIGLKIYDNTISYNHNAGIFMLFSQGDNKIFHNNFIGNTYTYGGITIDLQAVDLLQSKPSVWDDGYPSGGNYWSDYKGVDLNCGPYQNVSGSDGIGDTAYPIRFFGLVSGQDRYPLMSPWTPPIPATVNIDPDTLNLKSRGEWITAYIELPEGYDVYNINVSSILLNNTIPVALSAPVTIGDYDTDGIPDLMVKFDRAKVISYILSHVNKTELIEEEFMTATLTIEGKLKDSRAFQGSTTITIFLPTPRGRFTQ
jgi:parallel beta-helix repeat protein